MVRGRFARRTDRHAPRGEINTRGRCPGRNSANSAPASSVSSPSGNAITATAHSESTAPHTAAAEHTYSSPADQRPARPPAARSPATAAHPRPPQPRHESRPGHEPQRAPTRLRSTAQGSPRAPARQRPRSRSTPPSLNRHTIRMPTPERTRAVLHPTREHLPAHHPVLTHLCPRRWPLNAGTRRHDQPRPLHAHENTARNATRPRPRRAPHTGRRHAQQTTRRRRPSSTRQQRPNPRPISTTTRTPSTASTSHRSSSTERHTPSVRPLSGLLGAVPRANAFRHPSVAQHASERLDANDWPHPHLQRRTITTPPPAAEDPARTADSGRHHATPPIHSHTAVPTTAASIPTRTPAPRRARPARHRLRARDEHDRPSRLSCRTPERCCDSTAQGYRALPQRYAVAGASDRPPTARPSRSPVRVAQHERERDRPVAARAPAIRAADRALTPACQRWPPGRLWDAPRRLAQRGALAAHRLRPDRGLLGKIKPGSGRWRARWPEREAVERSDCAPTLAFCGCDRSPL